MSLGGGTSRLELSCVLHWFSLWDAQQREAFSDTLLAHLAPSLTPQDPAGELCGQLGDLSLSSVRPPCPPVLLCQLSLCDAYFASWGPRALRDFVHLLAQRDGDFVARLLGSLAQRGEPLLAQALAP